MARTIIIGRNYYLTGFLHERPLARLRGDLKRLGIEQVEGQSEPEDHAAILCEIMAGLIGGDIEAPPGTERDVLKGTTAHLPIYADATYLFLFRSTASGIATAIGTLSSELASGGARTDGSIVRATLASASPAEILLQPIFNPVGGYASYAVPAAFVLILQQTLLMGVAMLTAIAFAQGGARNATTSAGSISGAFTNVLGRAIAHLTIYLPALALYLIVLPRFYGFSALGHPLQLLVLAALFILATSFMGQAVGAWFTRPETPMLVFLATSLPQFFLAGFAWPSEAIPKPVLAAGSVFPADVAIDGIVRINQLGASAWEVAHAWRGLWLLAIVYFVLAVISARLVQRRPAHA